MRTVTMFCAVLALTACGNDNANDAPAPPPVAQSEAAPVPVALPRTPAPAGARVYFIEPADGAQVSSPVRIEFGAEGVAIVKAGDNQAASGHHHLIVDADLPDPSLPIPASERYIHFGDGSTATELTLAPGEHTLTLLLGDHLHVPHDPPVRSETITIVVTD